MPNECDSACDQINIATLSAETEDLKQKIAALEAELAELKRKLSEAEEKESQSTDALNKYKDAEKKSLLDSIPLKSSFKADELKDKPLEELRTISLAIDKVPTGTVKNVRAAGASTPTRPNIMDDGRIDPSKSLMGHPELQTDGSIKWVQ